MNKVAVFGGSGFLGAYLVAELLRREYKVTILDINEPVEVWESVIFEKIDITDRLIVIEKIVNGQFDFVYNLAGFAKIEDSISDPYRTFQLNVLANINIVDACVKANIKRYLYASSAYAMSNKGSFYGISKLSSEKIVEEYGKKHQLPFTIMRYGSVYSEKPYENNYIYNLVKNALLTGKIEHGGTGEEVREYIHAADAAKLSVDVLEKAAFINEHVIFTGTEKIKRNELFELINEIVDNKLEIVLNKGDYQNHYKQTPYSYSPTLSRKLVANPHIDMGQGVLECIKSVFVEYPEIKNVRS